MSGAITGHARAERLKAKILAYWKARGLAPKVWLEPIGQQGGDQVAVRSSMVNGQPVPEPSEK